MSHAKTSLIEQEFYQGQYRKVLDLSVDAVTPEYASRDLGWIIGALSFLGRSEDADLLFKNYMPKLSIREKIQARFFLGIGFSRLSQYSRARHYFGENLRERKKPLTDDMIFFAYQGLAFNRYFSGRFRAAERSSAIAYEAAMKSGYLFGKVLSADMRGHILIQKGELSTGLKILDQAMKYAEVSQSAGVIDAIKITSLIYQSEFGLNPPKGLKSLQQAIKKLSPQDTYSKSSMMLEVSHQFLLRGQPQESSKVLDQASLLIYGSQNRGHEVSLNFRYANVLFQTGEYARALSFLRLAKKNLDRAVDHAHELAILGLELKILDQISLNDNVDSKEDVIAKKEIRNRIEKLSGIFGGSIQSRITERNFKLKPIELTRSEDKLGHLKDEVSIKSPLALEKILKSEYLAFLYDLLEVPRSTSCLYLSLVPSTITLFDRGEVRHSDGLTSLLKSLAVQIANGQGSKKQLIEKIWGYTYHPLRHDSIVYSGVTALRKLLRDRAHWIETTEIGYRLFSGVIIRTSSNTNMTEPSNHLNDVRSLITEDSGLNLRQFKILRHLQKTESIDVRTCQRLFKVSEITASRDLSGLHRTHHVIRVGRGRATQYVLTQENSRKTGDSNHEKVN